MLPSFSSLHIRSQGEGAGRLSITNFVRGTADHNECTLVLDVWLVHHDPHCGIIPLELNKVAPGKTICVLWNIFLTTTTTTTSSFSSSPSRVRDCHPSEWQRDQTGSPASSCSCCCGEQTTLQSILLFDGDLVMDTFHFGRIYHDSRDQLATHPMPFVICCCPTTAYRSLLEVTRTTGVSSFASSLYPLCP